MILKGSSFLGLRSSFCTHPDSNKCYRNTRESHCEPAACFKPPWNRVKCLSVQFGGSVLISKSSFADKSTVPWYMLSNLSRYFEENNLKQDNSTVCQQSIFTQNQTMSQIRHSVWPIEHRLVSKIIIAYR